VAATPSIASTIGDASERSTGSCRFSVCSSGDEHLGAPVDAPDRRRWSLASSAGGASAASSAASTLSSSTAGGDRAVADALRSWDGAGFQPALVGQLRSAADALARGRSVLRRRSRGWAASPPASAAAAEAAAGDQVLTGSTKALAAAVRSLVLALEAERLQRERAEVAARLLVPGGGMAAALTAATEVPVGGCGWPEAVGGGPAGGLAPALQLPTSPV